jgi:heme oxygenase
MSDLAKVLPALDERVKLTWLKRDIAELTADACHEDLLRLCGGNDENFKKMLALYAGSE